LKAEIQQSLGRLVGLDLIETNRAADLQHFTFGRHPLSSENSEAEFAEFALHLLCPWRLCDSTQILVAHGDYWRPASPFTSDASYESGKIGSRLRDARIEDVRTVLAKSVLRVERIKADDLGGFVLQLAGSFTIEAFPDASSAEHDEVEFWRLFQPRLDTAHFVVSSAGIDRVMEA
jgi:hypothetical protein